MQYLDKIMARLRSRPNWDEDMRANVAAGRVFCPSCYRWYADAPLRIPAWYVRPCDGSILPACQECVDNGVFGCGSEDGMIFVCGSLTTPIPQRIPDNCVVAAQPLVLGWDGRKAISNGDYQN